ncbi:MAG TPA: inositol monophosphatase family protein [Marinagarivorans sp.]
MFNSQAMKNILAAVARACEAVMMYYEGQRTGAALQVSTKANNTPLTRADTAAHKLLAHALFEATGLPVLSEEGEPIPYPQRQLWPAYWLIDPLDGTKEFIAASGQFTVNVALIAGARSVLGVVAAPCTGAIYCGVSVLYAHEAAQLTRVLKQAVTIGRLSCKASVSDWSACANPSASSWDDILWTPIKTRAIAIGAEGVQAGAIVALTSRAHHDEKADYLLRCLSSVRTKPVGSSLKMCLIAEGVADVYVRYGPTSEWDTGAAQAVLEGAGGKLADLDAKPLRYNQKASLLNPAFWASSGAFYLRVNDTALVLNASESKRGELDANSD